MALASLEKGGNVMELILILTGFAYIAFTFWDIMQGIFNFFW